MEAVWLYAGRSSGSPAVARGNARPTGADRRPTGVFMTLPGVPGDLDSTGKKLYRDLRSAMQSRPDGPTQWTDPDHHLLSQACRYNQRARHARDAFKDSP